MVTTLITSQSSKPSLRGLLATAWQTKVRLANEWQAHCARRSLANCLPIGIAPTVQLRVVGRLSRFKGGDELVESYSPDVVEVLAVLSVGIGLVEAADFGASEAKLIKELCFINKVESVESPETPRWNIPVLRKVGGTHMQFHPIYHFVTNTWFNVSNEVIPNFEASIVIDFGKSEDEPIPRYAVPFFARTTVSPGSDDSFKTARVLPEKEVVVSIKLFGERAEILTLKELPRCPVQPIGLVMEIPGISYYLDCDNIVGTESIEVNPRAERCCKFWRFLFAFHIQLLTIAHSLYLYNRANFVRGNRKLGRYKWQ
jgi:hypothetical protein